MSLWGYHAFVYTVDIFSVKSHSMLICISVKGPQMQEMAFGGPLAHRCNPKG